jgi:hypothetical protein
VVDIVAMLTQGKSAEQMLLAYPSLNLAQVHAAISYYHENKDEIEAELAEDGGWEEEHERRKTEYLRTAKKWPAASPSTATQASTDPWSRP